VAAAVIEIQAVHKSYAKLEVLKGISMSVAKGEVVAMIGASGSGKSTLLQCINGLEPIDSGRIIVDGINVHARGTDINKLRRRIGIVFQSFNVFPHYTVLENVALAPRIVLGLSRKAAAERAREYVAKVGLADKSDVFPGKLSGGQQQRLAIARALAMNPDYMLCDEITSALDPELVGEVLDTLRMLSRDGMTMIVVTHEISFAREVADRVVFFDAGVICESGPPAEVIDHPKNERTRQFLRKVR
jgi:polar amino acid transport system ATP-binding protein